MSGKSFDGIDALVKDIDANYQGAEVVKKQASTGYQVICNGKYHVVSVGEGTAESIMERLTTRKKTKLVYLILEETDG